MAELSSGPQPPPASEPSPPPLKLPQAQAENILASLASRSTSSRGTPHGTPSRPKPSVLSLGGPGPKGTADRAGAGHTGSDAGAPVAAPRPDDPYNNDILPAKSKARFRLR